MHRHRPWPTLSSQAEQQLRTSEAACLHSQTILYAQSSQLLPANTEGLQSALGKHPFLRLAARPDPHDLSTRLVHRYRESAASDEQQLRTPEDGRVAQLTTDVLVTRINSLLYIEENLPAMEKIVQDRSAADTFNDFSNSLLLSGQIFTSLGSNHYFSRVKSFFLSGRSASSYVHCLLPHAPCPCGHVFQQVFTFSMRCVELNSDVT